MKSIGGFFDRFNTKITKKIRDLVLIVEIIKKHSGIEVDMKDISISNGVVRIEVSSIQKNEIFIKKARIIKEINDKVVSVSVQDIR